MRIMTSLAALVLLGAVLQPAIAQDKPAHGMAVATGPGKGAITEVVRVSGIVDAIDLPSRHVVIKGASGKLFAMAIGPEARNLEQVKVGDQVSVSYAQALTLSLMKDGKELRGKAETPMGARSAEGDRPAGAIGKKVEVTADVTAVNTTTHVVTLRGPKHEVDIKVRDPEQLKLIKVGDQVQAVYTEAVALSVEPAKK